MKNQKLLLLFIVMFFISQPSFSVVIKAETRLGMLKLKRTYSHTVVKRDENRPKNNSDISITFEDFTNHFQVGRNRILTASPSTVVMNIGEILSEKNETWVMPDISTMEESQTFNIEQLDAKGTAIYESFGYGTHVLYSEKLEINELYDLTDFDLYFVGYSEIENDELVEYEYDQTKAPIPVELGTEYSSTVRFGDDEYPEDYIEYVDTYWVVGQGTLKTYDDGDVDAMKLIYQEEFYEYIDDELVDYDVWYEIVFYSKEGHYFTAEIEDPEEEGEVSLSYLNYHKLEPVTLSVDDNQFTKTISYPNPINAGSVLTLESPVALDQHVVDVYSIQGQKVSTLQFEESNSQQYRTTVPANLSSGLYIYKVQDQAGRIISDGKILIK